MYDLPELDLTERFRALTPFMEARGVVAGGPLGRIPPGAELAALREAVPDVRAELIASGTPLAVTTCDLITLPYPTEFGLWRAGNVRSPYLWITNRMLVVQWDDPDGELRTLLWEPSDHELGDRTPFFARLKAETPIPQSLLTSVHGTVLGHLRALGIDPEDVDYLAFDHLHTQDVRRLVGTTRPAPDLGYTDRPVPAWFPNATLLTQAQEWEALRHLHPLQAPWYQPETYLDLPPDRLALVGGDVLLGPGVGLLATPGHTAGNMSLVLHTDGGLWTSSENGIAAECWAPESSRISGLRRFRADWGQEVVLNANTIEFAAWQYDSMIVESLVADRTPDGLFPQCFPSSELTGHRLSPGTKPTYVHGGIEHGRVRPGTVLTGVQR
ncbi:MAG: hypothetical protein KY461_13155 [Actinobacteria bacterium]|nr:hypothetical protein [Actinomycetota bacterium]